MKEYSTLPKSQRLEPLPSDVLMLYPVYSLGSWKFWPFAEMQSVYSTASADLAKEQMLKKERKSTREGCKIIIYWGESKVLEYFVTWSTVWRLRIITRISTSLSLFAQQIFLVAFAALCYGWNSKGTSSLIWRSMWLSNHIQSWLVGWLVLRGINYFRFI